MNKNSRSYKILSQAKFKSGDENGASAMQPKNKLTITDADQQFRKSETKVLVLSDITIASSNSEYLSVALENLKEECIQAQKVLNVSKDDLQENIDPNLTGNEDFVTEILSLDNTDNLDAFIDIDTINNADITFEEANYKDTNLRQNNNNLNNDQETLEENNGINSNVSKDIDTNGIGYQTGFGEDININAVESDNFLLSEDEIERENSSEEEENVGSDNKNKKRKRKKNRLSDSQDWECNTNKKKRQAGASYMGTKNNKFVVQKNERKLKIRCSCCDEKGSKKKRF